MDIKKELNSRFMGDRSRLDYLADIVSKQIEAQNLRIDQIQNAVGLMQEALMRMEIAYNTIKEDIYAKPKRGRPKKGS
jgi:flagellar biosynthesis chaperone FliJ